MMTRYRTPKPAIPFIFLSDTDGNQSFDSTGAFHTWDTVEFKTSDFHYVADDDRIIINRAFTGYYELTFEFSSYTTDSVMREVKTDLYKNGVLLTNSHVHSSVAGSGGVATYRDQQTISYIVYLSQGDYIQVKTLSSAGTVFSDPTSSRLMIKFIPMLGWNNNSSGKELFRGAVMR